MAETKKNEIVETKSTAMSMPAEFAQFAGAGAENIGSSDIRMAYLQIAGSSTDYVKKGTENYIKGAQIGDIVNTITKQIFNEDKPARIVPIITRKVFTEWVPKTMGGGFKGHHATSEGAIEVEIITDQGTKKKVLRLPNGNDLIETQYYLCLQIDEDNSFTPVMLSMSSTRLSNARDFNTIIHSYTAKSFPVFAALIQLDTILRQKESNSWHVFKISKVDEHSLLKEGFLDIANNAEAKQIFNAAVALYNVASKDASYFLKVVDAGDSPPIETTGTGTTSAEAKSIL